MHLQLGKPGSDGIPGDDGYPGGDGKPGTCDCADVIAVLSKMKYVIDIQILTFV